jgi:hypothetical protein
MTTREQVAEVEAEMQAAQVAHQQARHEWVSAALAVKAARQKRDKAHRVYLRHFGRIAMLLYGPDADPAIREERLLSKGGS